MKITLRNDEMKYIIRALDFYSRIWIGQYEEILFDYRWYKHYKDFVAKESSLRCLLIQIRNILLPDLEVYGFNASYGIFSPEINYRAAVAYNMQQVFRYTIAYFEYPEGGIAVDFNKPLKADLDPYIFPTARCFKKGRGQFIEIDVCQEQLDIIKDALIIQKHKFSDEINNLFSFYCDNDDVHKLSLQMEEALKDIKNDKKQTITIRRINKLLTSLSY